MLGYFDIMINAQANIHRRQIFNQYRCHYLHDKELGFAFSKKILKKLCGTENIKRMLLSRF